MPESVVDGNPMLMRRPFPRVVPMGWLAATDVAQAVLRRLVYRSSGIDPSTEIRKDAPMPGGPVYSLTYLDGFEQILRLKVAVARALLGTEKGSANGNFARHASACVYRCLLPSACCSRSGPTFLVVVSTELAAGQVFSPRRRGPI